MTHAREAVVAMARHWIGVKWRHHGRNEHAIDCIGLPVMVCRALGLSDYDSLDYGREPDVVKLLRHAIAGGATRIPPLSMTDGDLVAFRPCHVGILSTLYGVRHVIHAHASRGMVVEEAMGPGAPLVAAFQLPGVA